MSKFPSCEKDNLKFFINILKAYELNQQRLGNIKIVENQIKTQVVLVDQQEQGGHFRVAKKEPQKVVQPNLSTTLTKEELQEFEHQRSNPSAIKEETKKTKIQK